MEKVIITECNPIMDGKAHGVTLSDGRKCTAWNDKINAGALMQMYAAHKPVLMEIVPYTSRAGKQGFNIKAIGNDTEVIVAGEPSVPTMPDAASLSPKGQTNVPMFSRDKSIVAQCCLKGAIELAKGKELTNNEVLGEFLSMAVVECVGAYKLALNQLE